MRKGLGDIIDASSVDVTAKVSGVDNIKHLKNSFKMLQCSFHIKFTKLKKQKGYLVSHREYFGEVPCICCWCV